MNEELKRKIGQFFMAGIPKEGLTKEYLDFCKKYYIGNFTVNANDSSTTEGLCAITSTLRKNTYEATGLYPLIEIDQEGGWVTRFYEGAAMVSGAMSFSASRADASKMRRVGEKMGAILRSVGCNMCDAPVLDVNINPNNPIIGTRSFGETPESVIEMALPVMHGLQSQKVISAVKHFPGHGNVSGDTHTDIVHNATDGDTLHKTEYLPFKKAFDEGAGAIMTAHVIHDAISPLPATVAPEVMTGLLREELNFKGIVVTDAMGMRGLNDLYPNGRSSPKAIIAGCDLLLYYIFRYETALQGIEAVYAAVESGEITEERINETYDRLKSAKERFDIASAEPDLELARNLIYNEEDIAENFADKLSSITAIKDNGLLKELPNKNILCVSPVCNALRGVEEKRKQILSFADLFAKRFENSTACVSALTGLTPEVEASIKGEYDVAVVGIFDAAGHPEQLEVLNAAKKTGKPTVAVLLRSPYDYRLVKDCDAVVTGYEYTTLAANALVEAMYNCDYRGIMPVTLPEN